MPSITICPLCRKSLVVPAGVDARARVRCPLCESEYGLHLVLGDVVEVPMPPADETTSDSPALPPEFVPVAHVGIVVDTSVAEPDDVLADDAPAADSMSDSVESPADARESTPEETGGAVDATDSSAVDADYGFTLAPSVRETPAAGPDAVYAVSGHDDDPGFTLAHPDPYSHPREAAGYGVHGHDIHAGDHGHEAPHDVSHLDFIPGVGGSSGPPVSRALSDLRAQQKSRPSHALAKFIGVAVFGALGVGLAYVAMSLVNPAKFDFLHIWGRPKSSAPANGHTPSSSSLVPTDEEEAKWR